MEAQKYNYGEWMEELSSMITAASEEIEKVAAEKSYTLQGHLESYKLLETLWLLDNFKDHSSLVEKNVTDEEFMDLKKNITEAAKVYGTTFEKHKEDIISTYDQENMEKQVEEYMMPWTQKVERAERRLENMKHLHSTARKASEVFQGHNLLQKILILGKLRKEAGFKLRRNRVCNFAAKTFDLVNEAQADLNKANNGLHNSNVKYKCIGDLYSRINNQLKLLMASM